MRLRDGGIDIFYIDESNNRDFYVVAAVAVPFLRRVEGVWTIVWPAQFEAAKTWRQRIRDQEKVPTHKELHGNKLASGAGHFHYGKKNFSVRKATLVYREVLRAVDFLPNSSVMAVAVKRGSELYGRTRLEAAMYGLFQRMRKQCNARNVNAMVFFDQGHPEYRTLYRMAQRHLPTGSRAGRWSSGAATENMPLDMFTKDGNEKNSRFCNFTQLADLVAYSAFLKVRSENAALLDWQAELQQGTLYDELPRAKRNLLAQTNRAPQDGIARLW